MDSCGVAENAISASSASVKIGILGGIGHGATCEFYNKLIKELQKRKLIKRNTDYPHIIINSIPASELVRNKISSPDLKPYVEGVKLLDKIGVDFIVMVCNTIHLYFRLLQREIKTPILDLRKEVRLALISKRKRVLVLGTPATITRGLYEFPGIKYSRLGKKEMNDISHSILQFNQGFIALQGNNLSEICRKRIKNGTQIILACTELSLMLEKEGIPNISTLDILVYNKYKGRQNKTNRSRLISQTKLMNLP